MDDQQPHPARFGRRLGECGGQVFRAAEAAAKDPAVGPEIAPGLPLIAAFRDCGASYRPATTLWHLDPDEGALSLATTARSETVTARRIVLATGAQERPVLIRGWTLPGVMTAGAAQILLKSAGAVPAGRTVLAGQGPLVWLLAVQLAYTDFQAPGMWVYGNAHYLIWLLPLGGAGLWLWLRAFGRWRDWAITMTATLALLAIICIRPLPVAVGPDQPARMLLFQGNLLRHWSEAYFASAVVWDAEGTMKNVGGFHQLPDDLGEREIAISRLFAGPAERLDPGESPPYDGWQRPYARYAVRLSFGWPCWDERPACRLTPPAIRP